MTHRFRTLASIFATLALAALSATASAGSREEVVKSFEKTVALSPGARLSIDHKNGDIRIRTQKAAEVKITAKIHGSSSDPGEIRKFLEAVSIAIEGGASGVSVRTEYPEKGFDFRGHGYVSFCVDYEIVMPESCPLEVRTRFGDVDVEGVKASADIKDSNGKLALRDGKGPIRAENQFGPIDVARIQGDVTITNSNGTVTAADIDGSLEVRDRFGRVSVSRVSRGVRVMNGNGAVALESCSGAANVDNSFGRVEIRFQKGSATVENTNGATTIQDVAGNLSARGSFGTMDLSEIGGPADVRNANGAVKLHGVKGAATVKTSFGMVECARIEGDLSIENANGAVRASEVKGAASIRTSFASVTLDGVSGRVSVDNQNGAIDVSGLGSRKGGECHPVELKTSFSPIRVALPEDSGWNVDARTSFGRIEADVPISVVGSLSTQSIQGKIGDGRCPLTLTNNNGSITIQKSR
jgi:DUF4097 and DUF4098 domain-containing protein YvlB